MKDMSSWKTQVIREDFKGDLIGCLTTFQELPSLWACRDALHEQRLIRLPYKYVEIDRNRV